MATGFHSIRNAIYTKYFTGSGAAMYGISIAMSSNNLASFAITLFYSLLMAGGFGSYSQTAVISNPFQMYQFYGLLLIVIFNIIERYNRHVINKEEVLSFMKGDL